MTKADPGACKHPMTSVVSTRTFTVDGKQFTEQKMACVDCSQVCETNII